MSGPDHSRVSAMLSGLISCKPHPKQAFADIILLPLPPLYACNSEACLKESKQGGLRKVQADFDAK